MQEWEKLHFKYSNFYEVSVNIGEGEEIKAHRELKVREDWFLYYYWEVKYLMSYCPEKYIVIPTIDIIMDFLDRDHIPYTIVVPDINLKYEYESRYKKRGNNQEFLDVFVGQWNVRITELNERAPEKIVLKSNQYLSDVLECSMYDDCQESYRNRQLLSFENSLKYARSYYDGMGEQDKICGILYNNPIHTEDIIDDYIIVESKQQLKIILETMDHEYRFEPNFCLLEKTNEEDGYKFNQTVFKCDELRTLMTLL